MTGTLINKLPNVRGRYTENGSLSKTTWFRVGGPAEVVFKPADVEDLRLFMKEKPKDVPVQVIGVGSNLLVRDGGVKGVVIRLGKGFSSIYVDGNTIEVGAAVHDRNVAITSQEEGIGGLEFFCGIPGTVGGALRMNAGCYGTEVKDVLRSAKAMDSQGNIHVLTPEECGFSYRKSSVPKDWIFLSASFEGHASTSEAVGKKIDEMLSQRESSQPVKSRTGGSTFANPDGHKAWELIDKAGCRGLTVGGAQMSEMHCNFMINTGTATATDLEQLGETVRSRVKETSGVDLRWEIQRIGEDDSDFSSERNAA